MALALAHSSPPDPTTADFSPAGGLPLVPELSALLPTQVLRRGGCVGVTGQVGRTSLLLKLLACPVAMGSWAAVIGMPALGPEAASEAGIPLDRLALVPEPGAAWLDVTAALLDAVDIVVLNPAGTCRPGDARRLLARARQRHSVLVLVTFEGRWPESPDLILETTTTQWHGLRPGHGSLRRCSITVRASGRRLNGPHRTGQLTAGYLSSVAG